MKLATVVLAAGEGTRMKSRQTKLLHRLAGKPVAQYAVDIARAVGAEETVFVIGKDGDVVREVGGEEKVSYVVQAERKGTGHAAMQARAALEDRFDLVLVYYGDMPLLKPETMRRLVESQQRGQSILTILTLIHHESMGFGRVIRGDDGRVLEVVEEKNCTPEQLRIDELNAGLYCFDAGWLWSHIDRIPLNPVKKEYYLTDMIGIAVADGQRVDAVVTRDADETIGINNRVHLSWCERVMRGRINERLMLDGVTLQDPASTYIDAAVRIGADTVVLANTHIRGDTVIGEDCEIGPNTVIEDCQIGDRCRVTASVLEEAVMEDDSNIGPFGHLRKGARLCRGAHMGNFGEMKNSTLGPGAKMGHFSYLGDATVGAEANIGAGTI
ncbi:MAG: bifunctional UDP-N-acetylglucosamine diphosphorylase/glucosamine-1-phosphate N-acetyltransferase GlmU, partial [Anaerolineae bacterium]|nr:bifunctional UDP-N-acetylglucosamine diphosphorylase/glucosamine-1-phosphate N-acetyltransferase GlmU [Anaerolineae bacterium]